jgi:NAD(P)H-dependent FMN reductase
MTESLTIIGLGGSLTPKSRSFVALRLARDGATEAGAPTSLVDLRELDLHMYKPDDVRR